MKSAKTRGAGGLFLLAASFLLMGLSAWAQVAALGTINGVIADPSGAVVPDVKVTVTNTATHQTGQAFTNASGFFVVPNLPSGDYDVKAEKQGFQACVTVGIHLDPAQTVHANCTMQLGQMTQSVEVQAPTVQVQTSQAEITRTVDANQVADLPVNGRNFVSLFGLQPGVVQSFSFNSFQAMSLFASQCTQVNGLTGESNNLLIDGIPATRTRANGATVAMPSQEAIGEVNIITTGYMPEFSRAAGGQFVTTLKSGTDHYHGDVFYYFRNDALDSRNFFSATVPVLRYNDFGFTVGGPVIPKHHKLYFFFTTEWQREISGNTWTGTVPSATDRSGNLAPYCAVFTTSCPTVPSYLGGQTVDGEVLTAGAPFPGDVIPASLFSANGSAMATRFYLQPNTITQPGTAYPFEGGLNFITLYNNTENAHLYSIKVDYNLTEKNHLMVSLRHYYGTTASSADGTGASSALLQQNYIWPSRGAAVDLATTFSPTLLNDFTAGANEDINHIEVPSGSYGGDGVDRGSLGINFPYVIAGGAASKDIAQKIPTLILSGFDTVSGLPYPSGSTGHVYTAQDVVTKISGNHTIKFGVWYEHDGENDHDQVRVSPGGGVGNNLNGQFEFTASSSDPNTTGSPYADALLGNFDNYSELGWRNYTPWYAQQIGFFGQDSWKITPHLTIQGGLRWDYFQPYRSSWCNFAMFQPLFYSTFPGVQQVVNPSTGFITSGNPYNGIGLPCNALPTSAVGHFAVLGQHLTTDNLASVNAQLQYYGMLKGLSPSMIAGRFDDFQPRLGFAWDPTGSGKSSIRAGAGIFYNHNTLSDVTLEGGVTPFQLAAQVFNGLADCPGSAVTALRTCLTTGAAAPNLPIPMTGSDMNNKTPVVYSWNFTVEHMFLNDTLVSVGYVGNRGAHMPFNVDANQPPIGTFTNPANAAINSAALRPYPGIGGTLNTQQEGESKYDSLQVSVQRRLARDLQYNVSYTYSKAFDMADSIYAIATSTFDPHYNWGLSSFNQTHNLIFTYVYTLPFARHDRSWIGQAAGGWMLSGDFVAQSGFPVNVTSNSDYLGNGVTSVGGTEFAGVFPNCNYRGPRTINEFFNTSCFYQPGPTAPTFSTLFGTVARGAIEGPGTVNWDLGVLKNGPITERIRYQFRAEFFNILNHASFNGVDSTVTDSTFGRVNSAISPRQIQFALKLLF